MIMQGYGRGAPTFTTMDELNATARELHRQQRRQCDLWQAAARTSDGNKSPGPPGASTPALRTRTPPSTSTRNPCNLIQIGLDRCAVAAAAAAAAMSEPQVSHPTDG